MLKLYNGCPNDELQAIWDANAATRAEAKKLGIHLTYFPLEEKYMACTSLESGTPYRELSGFHATLQGALEEAKKNV